MSILAHHLIAVPALVLSWAAAPGPAATPATQPEPALPQRTVPVARPMPEAHHPTPSPEQDMPSSSEAF